MDLLRLRDLARLRERPRLLTLGDFDLLLGLGLGYRLVLLSDLSLLQDFDLDQYLLGRGEGDLDTDL